MVNESKGRDNGFILIAIVAVVAVVGIVAMIIKPATGGAIYVPQAAQMQMPAQVSDDAIDVFVPQEVVDEALAEDSNLVGDAKALPRNSGSCSYYCQTMMNCNSGYQGRNGCICTKCDRDSNGLVMFDFG